MLVSRLQDSYTTSRTSISTSTIPPVRGGGLDYGIQILDTWPGLSGSATSNPAGEFGKFLQKNSHHLTDSKIRNDFFFEEEYTKAEIQAIKNASSFSKDASCLYGLLSGSITCQDVPRTQVKLDVSSFGSHRLEMLVSTCQETSQGNHWATFAR